MVARYGLLSPSFLLFVYTLKLLQLRRTFVVCLIRYEPRYIFFNANLSSGIILHFSVL
jgi:predicted component of type VI protein secretion system